MTWGKDIGRFVEWEIGKWHEFKFLHDEPKKIKREFKGTVRDGYSWEVEQDGVKRELQTSAYGLLRQLRDLQPLDNKIIRIMRMGEGVNTTYKVEVQKELK